MSGPHVVKTLSLEQYMGIEDELLASDHGRAFLRMRDQRSAVIALERHQSSLRSIKSWIENAADRVTEEAQLSVLRKELLEMAASIKKTKIEIAAIRPADDPSMPTRRIDIATAELDAIVQATERATTDILNGAEHIMELAGKIRVGGAHNDEADSLDAEATNILMACGFQDITGQRIAKVVSTLRYLEERVESMIRVWGNDGEEPSTFSSRLRDTSDLRDPHDTRPDAHLLNGPALEGGIDQSEVDALFELTPADPPAVPLDQSAIDSLFP